MSPAEYLDPMSSSNVTDKAETRVSFPRTRVKALVRPNGSAIRRFDIQQLNVIKISLPRPYFQGNAVDTDMHGASFAVLLEQPAITWPAHRVSAR